MWSWLAVVLLGAAVLSAASAEPWGYWPLLAAAAALGLTGLGAPRRRQASVGPWLQGSLAVAVAAVGVQLVPLPGALLDRISPARQTLAVRLAAWYGQDPGMPTMITFDWNATVLFLLALIALTLLFVGSARALSTIGVRRVAEGLTGLGALVALMGIVLHRLFPDAIYGIWVPEHGTPFGPFGNRNHFAGWMLMVVSLAMAYLWARLEQAAEDVEPYGRDWRGRVWWLTTPDASQILLTTGAVTVMAIALVQTQSRAGFLCFVAAIGLLSGWGLYSSGELRRNFAASRIVVALVVLGMLVAGAGTMESRLASASWSSANGRLPIWRQALEIAYDFPAVGTGLNTYETVSRVYERADLDRTYEAAHNAYLQVAAEGGLLVGLPFLVCLGCFVREVYERFREDADDRRTRWLRVGAIVGLLVIAAQEAVDYSLQVPATAALFAILAAIAIHQAPAPRREPAAPVRARHRIAEPPNLPEIELQSLDS